MLVNDVCGAPIRRPMTVPWLFFDGKLFQYKLLKASSAHHVQRLDLCDGQVLAGSLNTLYRWPSCCNRFCRVRWYS